MTEFNKELIVFNSESANDRHVCTLVSSCGDQIEFVYRTKPPVSYTSYSHDIQGDSLGWGIGRPVEHPTQKFEEACEMQMILLKEHEEFVKMQIRIWQEHLESIHEFMEMIPDVMLNSPKEIARFKRNDEENGDEKDNG